MTEPESFAAPADLAGTATALRDGRLSLTKYINSLCDVIAAGEPFIHALLPEAGRRQRLLKEARILEETYPEPADRPPLYGIPVGIKDVFHVDGFPTRAGSELPEDLLAGPEAAAVSLLRRAGALVAGKTVTTEFAYLSPGETRNPHNTGHTPGGSSSGSAAGVAAGFFPAAIGTQTVGSVIRPAAFCGIAGFKPTFGRIPRDGLLICADAADHVGMFSRDVAGLQILAGVLCRGWDAAAGGGGEGLPVLGVPDGPYLEQASDEALEDFETQLAMFEEAGYRVVRQTLFEDVERINRAHADMVAAQMYAVHREWFREYGALYRPETSALLRRGRDISGEDAARIADGRDKVYYRIAEVMDRMDIDVWVSPAAPGPAPPGLETTGDPLMNLPWTHTGMPAVTVPAGTADNGLPLGLQFSAARGNDEALLAYAAGCERDI